MSRAANSRFGSRFRGPQRPRGPAGIGSRLQRPQSVPVRSRLTIFCHRPWIGRRKVPRRRKLPRPRLPVLHKWMLIPLPVLSLLRLHRFAVVSSLCGEGLHNKKGLWRRKPPLHPPRGPVCLPAPQSGRPACPPLYRHRGRCLHRRSRTGGGGGLGIARPRPRPQGATRHLRR